MLDISKLKIITLSENTSSKVGLLAEWGLSIYIDDGAHKFVLDSGSGISASFNTDILDVNLKEIDAIILSHGHKDHTGGLLDLLKKMKKEIRIIAHPGVWDKKFVRKKQNNFLEYSGIPFTRESLESLGARFELTSDPTFLTDDIAASGEEPMQTDFESVPENFLLKVGDDFKHDSMPDDQSLFIRTNLGLVVILGCGHRGMINIIRHGQKIMKMEKVYMVIGGTHLHSAKEERVSKTIEALKEIGVEFIGVSHCTGLKVSARLIQAFGDKFFSNNTGTIIKFPFKL